MKLFKRKNKQKGKLSWYKVNLKTYINLLPLIGVKGKEIEVLSVLYPEVDFNSISIDSLGQYAEETKFLETIPGYNKSMKDYVTINDREYKLVYNLRECSVNQYEASKLILAQYGMDNLQELLSVFVIPKGHNYSDGYDMDLVKQDILELDMVMVNTMCGFFQLVYLIYIKGLEHYYSEEMKEMKSK